MSKKSMEKKAKAQQYDYKAARSFLKAQCIGQGSSQGGGMRQLIARLEKNGSKKAKKEASTTLPAVDALPLQPDFSPAPDVPIQKTIQKSKRATKVQPHSKQPSSESNPLTISAKEYVDVLCDGDLSKAAPEYVRGTKEIKRMIPEVRGSKSGPNLRWVMYRD